MANDDDDDGEFSPMPPRPLVANGEDHQWGEIFSPLSFFGYLEQEGEEDEDEYTLKNDDDGEDDDSGITSNHSRNSLHAFREAEGDEVEVVNAILAKHPFKAMKTLISKNSRLVSKGGRNFRLTESDWTEPLNDFICGVAGLRSCYNKRAKYFVNCACLSELQQFARAKQY
jgi:hypothetical protein